MPTGLLFVDYLMPDGSTRPALVVRDWAESCVSVQVFPDRVNDGEDPLGFGWFRSSCSRGDRAGCWRERQTWAFVPAPAPGPTWPGFVPGTVFTLDPSKRYVVNSEGKPAGVIVANAPIPTGSATPVYVQPTSGYPD
jgi:hypothetical protein